MILIQLKIRQANWSKRFPLVDGTLSDELWNAIQNAQCHPFQLKKYNKFYNYFQNMEYAFHMIFHFCFVFVNFVHVL